MAHADVFFFFSALLRRSAKVLRSLLGPGDAMEFQR